MKLKAKKKVALVLSGGGIKAAAFHIGVALALRQKGFQFVGGTKDQVRRAVPEDEPMTVRLYVGSSAGAFVTSILASGYSLEALINAFDVGLGKKPFFKEKSFSNLKPIKYTDIFSVNSKEILKSIPKTFFRKSLIEGGFEALLKNRLNVNGFFSTTKIEKYLREHALSHNEFNQLGVELFIVGTQLNHTRKVVFGNFPETKKSNNLMFVNYANISNAVAASISLPPVFAPYGIDDPSGKTMYFFDGEIRDTLSTHVAADHGADLIISSYSVQPYHYNAEIGSLHQYGIPVILNQALYQVIQQKIDRHISHERQVRQIYNLVDSYFKQNNLGDEHREKILEIIREKSSFTPKADYVYIHPRPQDHEMFFADHFSLNRKVLENIVKIGFKSAINSLRKIDL